MLQGDAREGSLLEHLEELRSVLLRMILSVAILFPLVFYFSDKVLELVIAYLCPAGMTLKFFSPVEPLMVQLKIGFYGAAFLASPYLLFQAWGFIAPGLYRREKSLVGSLVVASWLLFLAGAAFAVVIILPLVMQFSFTFESSFLQAAIGIGQFVGLIVMLILGFGLMFQLPAVVFFLIFLGLLDIDKVRKARPYVVLAIFTAAALLTPPDVLSQILLGLPTWLLFEIGLLLAGLLRKKSGSGQPEELDKTQESP